MKYPLTFSPQILYLLPIILIMGAWACSGTTSGETTSTPLAGRTIVVDPGHGGTALTDSFRVGPTGQREEWVNLRVSLLLRDLLAEAGANVLMTRTDDTFVELADRAKLAVDHQADLFISVHHNATADTSVNFPIIYYHGNASENRASVLLGRLLARQIRQAMFTPDTHISLVSDYTIFPTRGARVLSGSYGIPGVITEASFFSNRDEDLRLSEATYNLREAEALFNGIVEFFTSMSPDRNIIREKHSTVQLEPLPVFQEAERMRPEALNWALYVRDAAALLATGSHSGDTNTARHPNAPHSGEQNDRISSEADLEEALELATRSVRYFPDSPVARYAHTLREQALRRLGRTAEADEVRTRITEFYVPVLSGLHERLPYDAHSAESTSVVSERTTSATSTSAETTSSTPTAQTTFPATPSAETTMATDQTRIMNEILGGSGITLSARIQHSDGTVLFEHMADKQVPSASVIKIQILAAMLLAHDQGQFDIHDTHTLQVSDIVGGAGELQHSGPGTTHTYLDYARKMIRTSDNTATNVVIRAIGMDAVNDLSALHGGTQTRLARYMMDFDAIAQGRQNYTSAADMNQFLAAVMRGDVLNTASAQLFFEILDDCADQTMIAAGTPSHVTVANKSGTLDYLRGDSGVIFGDDTYIVSVFAENFPDLATAERAIASLVRRVISELHE
jgi:N-acetylmuramoyl-L-alanine amidase